MSTSTETKTSPVEVELRRYSDRLLPGAPEHLAKAWSALDSWPPALRAEEVNRRIEGKMAERLRNPDFVEPTGPRNILRETLARHSDELVDGAATVEALTAAWGLPLAMRPAHVLAGEVVRRLALRENRDYLKIRPELPHGERTIREALSTYAGRLRPDVDLDKLAEAWAADIPTGPAHSVRRAVAAKLAMPYFAQGLTADGQPIELDPSDPAFRPLPPSKTPRNNTF